MMAIDRAGSHSDRTSESWGSARSGSSRGIDDRVPTVGTVAKLAKLARRWKGGCWKLRSITGYV